MGMLSRMVDLLLDPANLVALLVVVGALRMLLSRAPGAGRKPVFAAAALAIAFVVLPIDVWLLHPLEQRFAAQPLPARVDGVIVLGGAQQPRLAQAYGKSALNERAERMTTFLALARRFPEAKLVFAGGYQDRRPPLFSEAQTMKMFLEEQGFDDARVVYETESTNTWENVVNAERLVQPAQAENWLVVASAADVPRTVGVFRRVGWPVIPVAVDYRVVPDPEWKPAMRLSGAFGRTYEGLHEWVGLVAYFLLGRSESVFPAP